jgi:hypothetical protein
VPRKIFVAGEILTAADVNTNLMDQAVMVFADSAARGSAIPSPSEGMVTYLSDVNRVEAYTGAAFVPVNTGFTAQTTFTVGNATQGDFVHTTGSTFTVPALAFPIVRVTVIGGGGGGGGGTSQEGNASDGGNGGTTTFNAGGAGSPSAAGGNGALGGKTSGAATAKTATLGNAVHNGGGGGGAAATRGNNGDTGLGGSVVVAYLNLGSTSTVDVTIGGGGSAGAGAFGGANGAVGGRGEVIVEYVAA